MPRFQMPTPKPWTERRICGITLAQYAAVHAGVGEGWPLNDVLAAEGVPEKVWARADDAWSDALLDTEDEAAEDAHDALFLAAQDRYGRAIPPVDRDLGAWLDLIRAFSADPEPLALLGRIGLRANDLLRLHRAWSNRLSEEPLLREEALARMAEPAGPVPVFTPEPARSAPPASESLADAVAGDDGLDDELDDGLDEESADEAPPPPLFAAMPSGSGTTSMSPTTAVAVAAAPPLANAAASQLSPVPAPTTQAAAPPRPGASRLNETRAFSAADFVAPGLALPFSAVPATPKEPTVEALSTPPRPAPTVKHLNETVVGVVMPGLALPFSAAPATPKEPTAEALSTPPRPAPTVKHLNETVVGVVMPGLALPFSAAPATPKEPTAEALSTPPRPAPTVKHLSETVVGVVMPGLALPFGAAPATTREPIVGALSTPPRPAPTVKHLNETVVGVVVSGLALPFGAAPATPKEPTEGLGSVAPGAPTTPAATSPHLAPAARRLDETWMGSEADIVVPGALGAPPANLATHVASSPSDPGDVAQPPQPGASECDPTAAMPLDRYAALCVALAESKEDAEVVFARFGLASLRERLAIDLAWRERLRHDPTLYAEFSASYAQHRAAAPVPVDLSAGGGPSQPERDPTATMPLDRYAALCVVLAESKEDAEVVFARFGLASLQERLAIDLAWRERLRREPSTYAEFQTLYARHRDALRQGDGHRRPAS